jgi:hypothetical protein
VKRYDDTPNVAMKNLAERVLCNGEKDECNEHYIHYIHSPTLCSQIKLARKTQPKIRLALDVRAALYQNFRQIAARVDARRPIVELIEAFMEQYVRVFSDAANAKINFFHPLPASKTGSEGIFQKAKLKLLKTELQIALKILGNRPEDVITVMKACRLVEENREVIESSQDPELEAMLTKLEELL